MAGAGGTAVAPGGAVWRDRVVGAVVASAAGDALGAPHEFGPALPADLVLAMTGGGTFDWGPGEWTDDTQQAAAVLVALAGGARGNALVAAVEAGLLRWYAAGPADVGIQTRAVIDRAHRGDGDLAAAAAAHQATRPEAAGNGSLMRTGPVALGALGRRGAIADLAARVSSLTHPHPDAVDACVLWSLAIDRAIAGPVDPAPDWVGLVAAGLDHLPADRQDRWRDRLGACRTEPPESFTPNGWVVAALQAALAAIAQTPGGAGGEGGEGTGGDAPGRVGIERPACRHLTDAIERVVRLGGDTDTVAAIAGALLGAHWGVTAVPWSWRRPLHGEVVRGDPTLTGQDLDRLARLAATGGRTDAEGWPGISSMLPHYRRRWDAPPMAVELVEGVRIGNVHAVPEVVAEADAVVSLCRMGTGDVPPGVEHHVVGLLDTTPEDNPNVAFVLADTADLVHALAGEDKVVFVHCVQAQNRTPAAAAAYLARHAGRDPAAALDEVEALVHARPTSFLADAVHTIGGDGRER